MNTQQKKEVKRPLCVANIVEYRGHSFLVAYVYQDGYTVAEIIAPLYDIITSGTNIAGKLIEIVEVNCEGLRPLAFDLYTCSDTIYKETLSSAYVLTQMKAKSECSECQRVLDNPMIREALDDVYINGYLKEIKDAKQQDKKERSVSAKLKRAFKNMRNKLRKLLTNKGDN
ncbi:hypothetical protein [Bacillus paramycoides]|uniref:hypothetical protein n=1 Tax=Bacillus paramycoides TaxID=2026194 RepID=UPI002E244398|nr:hypothetical protein [Bacillus paramycoides]